MLEETKNGVNIKRMGHPISEETKRKIGLANSIALKGKHLTEEVKKKLSIIAKEKGYGKWMVGKKHSEETKRKMREAHKGKLYHPMTDEIRKKISKTKTGTHQTVEQRKKRSDNMMGEKHWNWQGGKSFEPYTIDWTKTLKIAIRERDKYTCQVCGEKQGDRAFHVHHIDYNKENCNPNNLITLCMSCHMKTNFNREHWTNYFNTR